MPRLAGAAALGVAWSVAALSSGAAQQVSGSVDVGAAWVEYDGFLPSTAVSVSPALRVIGPTASFAARGTVLRFESGNLSAQGLVAGSVFTTALGRWRGELTGTAGASAYGDFARLAHVLGRGRLHYVGHDHGAWISGTLGRTSLGAIDSRPVQGVAFGGWRGGRMLNVAGSLSSTWVGDTSYTDVEGVGYWQRGRVEIEAAVGARAGGAAGHGVYGEASATFAVSPRVGLMLAGGRYPTDPTRSSVSGRYVSLAARLTARSRRPAAVALPSWPHPTAVALPTTASNGVAAAAVARVEPWGAGGRLIVHAPNAMLVEVRGDFTDWEPVALQQAGDAWRFDVPLPSGLRRLNIRVDGGPWTVPAGAGVAHDEFGAVVGTIVVP